MKQGSLIVPIIDYKNKLSQGFSFDPVIPVNTEVYTCEKIEPSRKNKDQVNLQVSETKILFNSEEVMFSASDWREIQSPEEGLEILKETINIFKQETILA